MDSNETPPPPSYSPPPVIAPANPGRPPRRGRGWMIFSIILLVLLAVSFFGNLSQLASGLGSAKATYSRYGGPRMDETIMEDNDSANKILVVDIDGIITSSAADRNGFSMVDMIKAQLKRAQDDNQIKALVIRMDSPGGEVLASDDIYRALTDFQEQSGKPVITSMGDLAASGGYYISSASRWIVANPLSLTGSIGVILHSWNYRGLMDKVGLEPDVYKSGKFKDMLSGERSPDEIPPQEHQMVQALVDQTFDRFKTVVAEGRARAHKENKDNGKALASDWKDYADGRVLSGKQAYDLGFVDELGDFDAAVDRAEEIAGIHNANLVQFKQRYDLADFLHIFGKSQPPVIKVDLGMDAPKLQAGRLYFIAPIFVH